MSVTIQLYEAYEICPVVLFSNHKRYGRQITERHAQLVIK